MQQLAGDILQAKNFYEEKRRKMKFEEKIYSGNPLLHISCMSGCIPYKTLCHMFMFLITNYLNIHKGFWE